MLAKYWPLLPPFILCLLFIIFARMLSGPVVFVMYGVAAAGFLLLVWQIASFVGTARKESKKEHVP